MTINILKLKDVLDKTKLSKSTIYNKISDGDFPKQIKLGERSIGFIESEVNEWLLARLAESRRSQEGI